MYARNARNSSSSPPLQWPDGWPRTKARLDGCARFSTGNGPVEFAAAREKLATELRLLRATSVVISFNRTVSNLSRSMDQSSIAGIPLAHSPKLSFSLTVELSVFMLVCAKLLHVEPQGPTAVRGIFCVTVPKLT